MSQAIEVYRVRPGWLPRALVSGFVASAVMLYAFIVAYGIAVALSRVELAERRGAETLQAWLYALAHNQLLDLASRSLYVAVVGHFLVGLLWAVVYAALAERRLRGPGWFKGLTFSLIPWLFSMVFFLPAVGGGLFGAALGAGPFPILGALLVHAVYGVVLGIVYSPVGDVDVERLVEVEPSHLPTPDVDAWAMASSESMAAIGIVLGAAAGLLVGLVALLAALWQPGIVVLGLDPLAFVAISVLVGAAFGGLIGSLAGLPSVQPRRSGGQSSG